MVMMVARRWELRIIKRAHCTILQYVVNPYLAPNFCAAFEQTEPISPSTDAETLQIGP